MKKIYAYAFGALLLAGAALVPTAHANAAVFNNDPQDCPTVMTAIESTGRIGGCYPTNVSATPGSVVNAVIYYHNNSLENANNVVIRLSPQNAGASSSHTFSGSISASNAATVSGQGTITLSVPQGVTFGTVDWYADQGVKRALPNGQTGAELFSGGLNLGTIKGYADCSESGGIHETGCHQGALFVSYRVGNTVVTPTSCDISLSAAASSVPYNGSTIISWNATNCNSFTVTGPNGFASMNLSGSQSTGQLTGPATYTATGYSANGAQVIKQVPVSVASAATCSITNFTGPTTVTSGNTATLSWNTQNCTSINVSGQNVSFASSNPGTVASGSTVTGAVYSTTQYTMTASNGTTSDTDYFTVSTSANNCTASLSPTGTQYVSQGQTPTFTWNSTGCTSVTISGPNGTISSIPSGSYQVPPVYGTATYNLYASASGGNIVNQSVTYTVSNVNTLSVITNTATGITSNSATFNGYINSNGSCSYSCSSSGTYYFQYGTTSYGMYSQTPTQSFYNSSAPVTAYVGNLLPNTTYYFQLVAQGSTGVQQNGGTLSFTTTGGVSSATALTLLATNVVQTSARLNGLIATSGNTNTYGTTYFEYGTTQALGRQTTTQNIAAVSSTNYFDTITTTASTTYFYRIVANIGGQIYYGSIISFTTPGFNVVVPPVVVVQGGNGGGSAFVSLSIDDQFQTVNPGTSMMYTVKYQNISNSTLSNAILNVILPQGVIFRQTSQGLFTTNNTVAITLGTLLPRAEGTIIIMAEASPTISFGETLVATATLAFTIPNKAQDTAIAYDIDSVGNPNNLAGLALFGAGFFPTSFLGWILLLGIILLLILMSRYFYHRANAQRPVMNQYYAAPIPVQRQAPAQDNGYQGDHLPH